VDFTVLNPELVWGLFPRIVGLIYVFAFGSLISQAEQIGGSRGQQPIQPWLARIRRDYPGVRRFWEYPTLLWFVRSDAALKALPTIGFGCGLCAIYGGSAGHVALLFAWIIWLSLEPLGLIFPWDTMLQEVGFLVLFVPTAQRLPSLYASSLPLPSVAFMARWFVLRLMFGFGKDKFIGVTKSDALYLRGFFVWMPLPNPVGWYAHHAPAWLLRLSHNFMFFAEIIAPVLGLFSGIPRVISCATLVALMIGIQGTGNWGYFNISYILLCVCLLDVRSSIFDLSHAPWAAGATHGSELAVHITMGVMFFGSLFYLPLNSWFTRSWVHWPSNFMYWKKQRSAMLKFHHALTPLRLLAPLRLLNGYGVFPPNSTPPLRMVPVFEGTEDGVNWKQYGYKYMPAFAHSRPPFLAPGHARFDQATYYFGNGIHSASLIGSALPHGAPHMAHARASFFDVLVQRLLAGDKLHLDALGHNPFPEGPPRMIRVGLLAMTPTRPNERRQTGHWWHTQRLGTLVRARGVESWPDKLALPEPELFHPDFVGFKRRSPALRAVLRTYRTTGDLDHAVLQESDLTVRELGTFWDELLPMLSQSRGDWQQVHARARALEARFDVEALYRLERVFERLIWILRERIATDSKAAPLAAALPVTNFRYHLMLHQLLLDGRQAFEAVLQQPESFAARVQDSSDETQLWALALLRHEQLMAHVCGFRWCEVGLRAHEGQLPGLFEYYPFLVRQVPEDEDFCPRPIKHDDGEYTIEGFYPPPALQL
jgi:Lipase maturation factor